MLSGSMWKASGTNLEHLNESVHAITIVTERETSGDGYLTMAINPRCVWVARWAQWPEWLDLWDLVLAYLKIEEETGYRIQHVEKVFEVFMNPGSVTEKLYFFIADDDSLKTGKGGGLENEGEDIEVLELPLSEALEMIHTGEIVDGKTIMLLQHAALRVVTAGGCNAQ